MWRVDPFRNSISERLMERRERFVPCSSDYDSAIKDANCIKSFFFNESVSGNCTCWAGTNDGHASNVLRHFVKVSLPLGVRLKFAMAIAQLHHATGRDKIERLSGN
jgi:hypothetical protein